MKRLSVLLCAALLIINITDLTYAVDPDPSFTEYTVTEASEPVKSEEDSVESEQAVEESPIKPEDLLNEKIDPLVISEEEMILEEDSDKAVNESVAVVYTGRIEKKGWSGKKNNGEILGTTGSGYRLEQFKANVESLEGYLGDIEYRSHVQGYGWEKNWRRSGEVSGDAGKRLEAICLRLTGELEELYDIYYRVHVQTYGWLDWAANGAEAGTAGYSKRIEALQIMLVTKDAEAPGNTGYPFISNETGVEYSTHVQSIGWQSYRRNGAVAGTSGLSKRLEGIRIRLINCPYEGSIEYMTHIQSFGWEKDWSDEDAVSGTVGIAKRLEAIRIRLTGQLAEKCDIWYRVHSQRYGWLGWVCNGAEAGTAGYGFRLEAIEIMLLPKNARSFSDTAGFLQAGNTEKSWKISGIQMNASGSVERGTEVELCSVLTSNPNDEQVFCTYEWKNQLTDERGIIGIVAAGEPIGWTPEFSGNYTVTMTAAGENDTSSKATGSLMVTHGAITREDGYFTAHKGGSNAAPGNTLPAFILAGQAGFDAIETDVCQTKDGVFVLSHDDNIKNTTGHNVKLSDLTYNELEDYNKYHVITGPNVKKYSAKELRIPRLEEYLEICKEYGCTPEIDTKELNSFDSIEQLYQILCQYEMEDKAIVTSFNNLYLQYMRQLDPNIALTFGIGSDILPDYDWLMTSNIGISGNYEYLLKKDLTDFSSREIPVNAYTVNDPMIAGVLLEKGILHITTDSVLWE